MYEARLKINNEFADCDYRSKGGNFNGYAKQYNGMRDKTKDL